MSTLNRRTRLVRSAYLALFLSPVAALSVGAAVPFVTETVDDTGMMGEWASLAVGTDGRPHISYYDGSLGHLRYATRVGQSWIIEEASAGELTGLNGTSIALDSQNRPHICFMFGISGDIRYTEKTSGTWSFPEVVDGSSVFFYPSLALDSQDNPRVSYYDVTNNDLEYAEKNGGWSTVLVSNVGGRSSLKLDADDSPRISYYRTGGADNDLFLAERDGGGNWSLKPVLDLFEVGGEWNSMALDPSGAPLMSYYNSSNDVLKFAYRENNEVFVREIVDTTTAGSNIGMWNSIAVDQDGKIGISYFGDERLKYAEKNGSTWEVQIVDFITGTGKHTSLALDPQGNPMIAYWDENGTNLKFADSAIHLTSPLGGETWPVGADRTITWKGGGPVDVLLSVDGGQTYQQLAINQSNHAIPIKVPHTPTRFALLQIRRGNHYSTSESDSFFTIEADINLLGLSASVLPDSRPGVLVQWNTDPGPEDLAGYRLERSLDSENWTTIASLSSETSYHDVSGSVGATYRLYAVNGFGTEYLLGETTPVASVALAAWPLPYRGGELTITFATAGGLGGSEGKAEVALYGVRGQHVRTIVQESLPAGVHTVTWDGRDETGRKVAPGVYYLRSRSGGEETKVKLVVLD